MATAYQEITVWEDSIPNHIYYLDDDKALAYINAVTGETKYFSKPLQIDKRYRKFQKLDVNPFAPVEADPALIEVKGSKGDIYYVDPKERTCSCSGFKWRGKCKHLDAIK